MLNNKIIEITDNGNFIEVSNGRAMELNRNGDIVFITPEYDAKGKLYDFHHDISKTRNTTYFTYSLQTCRLH